MEQPHTDGSPPKPDVWLTITMSGTRTPQALTDPAVPDAEGTPIGIF